MINAKNKHLQSERETWLGTLDDIRQENVFLKNRLAYIVMNGIDTERLEEAEYFQSLFVNKDTIIALLRYDIAAQNKNQANEKEQYYNLRSMIKKQDRLRADMKKVEEICSSLKSQFNEFMAKTHNA